MKSQIISGNDFFSVNETPAHIKDLIRNACYDCHSNETVFPWYSHVAPVSWLLNNHIAKATGHMNFSNWGSYSHEEREDLLESSSEEIGEGDMPLFGYRLMHAKARFTESEKEMILDYLNQTAARSENKDNIDGEDEVDE